MNTEIEPAFDVDFGPVLDSVGDILSDVMFSWLGLAIGLYFVLWWYEHLTGRVFFTASKEEIAERKRERRRLKRQMDYQKSLSPLQRERAIRRKAFMALDNWAFDNGYSRREVRNSDALKMQFLEDFKDHESDYW